MAQKLETEVAIQKTWADAFARRQVPQYVFGGGEGTPTGSDHDVKQFMNMLTVDAAKRLAYDRQLDSTSQNTTKH